MGSGRHTGSKSLKPIAVIDFDDTLCFSELGKSLIFKRYGLSLGLSRFSQYREKRISGFDIQTIERELFENVQHARLNKSLIAYLSKCTCYELILLSLNSQESLLNYAAALRIENLFSKIIGTSGVDKYHSLLIEGVDITLIELIIGDSVADERLARLTGGTFIRVIPCI